MFKRFCLFLVNVFFPPLGVLLLTGPEMDMVISCCLFLLAIIPSHIHAFYISWTYFGRKKKVRKGIYPGDRRAMIYSQKVQYGGATEKEYQRLKWEKENGIVKGRLSRKSTTKRRREDEDYQPMTQYDNERPQMLQRRSSRRNGGHDELGVPSRTYSGRNGDYERISPVPSRTPSGRYNDSQPVARVTSRRDGTGDMPPVSRAIGRFGGADQEGYNSRPAISSRQSSWRNNEY